MGKLEGGDHLLISAQVQEGKTQRGVKTQWMRVHPCNIIPLQYSLKFHTGCELYALSLTKASLHFIFAVCQRQKCPGQEGGGRQSRLPSNLHNLVMTQAFSLPISDILSQHVCVGVESSTLRLKRQPKFI